MHIHVIKYIICKNKMHPSPQQKKIAHKATHSESYYIFIFVHVYIFIFVYAYTGDIHIHIHKYVQQQLIFENDTKNAPLAQGGKINSHLTPSGRLRSRCKYMLYFYIPYERGTAQ